MTAQSQLLHELRCATDAQHRMLESHSWLHALTSDSLTVEQYARTLQCFSLYYGVLEALWEPWLMQTNYPYTRRFPLLQKDLNDINLALRSEQVPGENKKSPDESEPESSAFPIRYPSSPTNLSEFAGMLYVIEGSSQGSRVIGPRLQRQLNFNREYGARFFNIHQLAPQTWSLFCQWVEKNELKLTTADSIEAANRVFSTLYQSFQQCDNQLRAADTARFSPQERV